VGLQSWAVSLQASRFQYRTDEVLLGDHDGSLARKRKRARLLWRALHDFDVVHFNFGQTIMPQWHPSADAEGNSSAVRRLLHKATASLDGVLELRDLPLLRRWGKGIVVTYQGDDARQGDFCREHFPITFADEVEPRYYSPAADERKRRRIATFDRYADLIYALNPDLLHVLPARTRFLPYAHIDLRDWRPVAQNENAAQRPPVVVHAPSHRRVKGTRFVEEAISRLKAEGVPLEFALVEGLPNREARRIYERADLLVEQLLAGWYGGLAVELMALGKPVVCYLRETDLKFIPGEMRKDIPIINATPDTLYDVLKQWLTSRRQELPTVGRRSRVYAEKWHDPLKIAAAMKCDYETIMADKLEPGTRRRQASTINPPAPSPARKAGSWLRRASH